MMPPDWRLFQERARSRFHDQRVFCVAFTGSFLGALVGYWAVSTYQEEL